MNRLFPSAKEGTIAGDNVVYEVPGGKLQKLFVAPELHRIFHYRHEVRENILPLPLLSIAYAVGASGWVVVVNLALTLTSLGALRGIARAYEWRPWI